MVIKVILVFLLAMAVMAMLQQAFRKRRRKPPPIDRLRCPTCHKVHASGTPTRCVRPDCGTR